MVTEGYLLVVDAEKLNRNFKFPIIQIKCPARNCNYQFGQELYENAFSPSEFNEEVIKYALDHHMRKANFEDSIKCPLCSTSISKSELVHIKKCNHEFFFACLRNVIDIYYIEKKKGIDKVHCIFIDNEFNHCNCKIEINDLRKAIGNAKLNQLEDLKNKSEYQNIVCCNIECQRSFSSFDTDNKAINCPFCNILICKYCKIPFHEGNCNELNISKFNEEFQKISMSCPYCKKRNKIKEDPPAILECVKCKKQICSDCWCKMERVISHGKHYHRPNCKFYERVLEPFETSKENCLECSTKTEKCSKPHKLNKDGYYYNDSSEEIEVLDDN